MSSFNKILLGRNVKYLASQKNIKIGTLEEMVNVSIGYFSRLMNEDSKGNSTLMDTICMTADKLNVSVNTLISVDLTALTSNEIILSKFFDKLSNDTLNNRIIWDSDSKKKLENSDYNPSHPLYACADAYGTEFFYHSLFSANVQILGDVYKTEIGKKTLYLVRIKNLETSYVGYEIYLYSIFENAQRMNEGKTEKVYNAYPESDLYSQVNDLYNSAVESCRHIKLSDDVLASINDYLNEVKF